MRVNLSVLLVLLVGCGSQPEQATDEQWEPSPTELHLFRAYALLEQRHTKKAIDEIDLALGLCGQLNIDEKEPLEQTTYASRGPTETMLYLFTHQAANQGSAIVVGPECADALYLKGYASIDLGRVDEAEAHVRRALKMSPKNSQYLSELGHIHQLLGDWQAALDVFTESEQAADMFSPEDLRIRELTRAKRGAGYSLIELGRIDEAEVKFRQSLKIDPGDDGAKHELGYIKKLRFGELEGNETDIIDDAVEKID